VLRVTDTMLARVSSGSLVLLLQKSVAVILRGFMLLSQLLEKAEVSAPSNVEVLKRKAALLFAMDKGKV
jgi:hypothetical protein